MNKVIREKIVNVIAGHSHFYFVGYNTMDEYKYFAEVSFETYCLYEVGNMYTTSWTKLEYEI